MRFGIATTDTSIFPMMKKYGYSLIEPDYQAIHAMTETERLDFCRLAADNGLALEGVNCFATADMSVLAWSEIEADKYFKEVVTCGKSLGVQYVVIGSGKARSVPKGMDRKTAVERWQAMLRRFGNMAEQCDVDIFLEPLSCAETNLLNTLIETVDCCREVAHPRVNCLADFYHMGNMKEPFSHLADAGAYLRHIHVALSPDRRTPILRDRAAVQAMAQAMRQAEYNGRVILEGRMEQPDTETAVREFTQPKKKRRFWK